MPEIANIDSDKDGLKVNYTPKKKMSSQKVKTFQEILEHANIMFAALRETGFPTLHHSELIVKQPYDFFVVNREVRFMWHGYGIIINPRIVEWSDPREIKESCAQFPFRGSKNMRRYNRITIEASTENPETGLLEPVVLDLIGEAAYLTQHNIDHARGLLLYSNDKAKAKKKK